MKARKLLARFGPTTAAAIGLALLLLMRISVSYGGEHVSATGWQLASRTVPGAHCESSWVGCIPNAAHAVEDGGIAIEAAFLATLVLAGVGVWGPEARRTAAVFGVLALLAAASLPLALRTLPIDYYESTPTIRLGVSFSVAVVLFAAAAAGALVRLIAGFLPARPAGPSTGGTFRGILQCRARTGTH